MICMNCMDSELQNNKCPKCGFDESAYSEAPCHLPLRTLLHHRYLIGSISDETNNFITYNAWDNKNNVKTTVCEYFPHLFVSRNSPTDSCVSVLPSHAPAFSSGKQKRIEILKQLQAFSCEPGIQTASDWFEEHNTFYYVLPYTSQLTLETFLATHKQVSEDMLFPLLSPLFRSLWKIHNTGSYHGMISPKQIYLSYTPSATFCFQPTKAQKSLLKETFKPKDLVLSGFESARFAQLDGCTTDELHVHSPYLPLESYLQKTDASTDTYALAAIIYRVLSGSNIPSPLTRLYDDSLINLFQKGWLSHEQAQSHLLLTLKPLAADRQQSLQKLYTELFQSDIDSTTPYYPESPRQKYSRANNHYLGINNCEQSYEKAFLLYQNAAEHGHRLAQCCLGICYYLGDGTEQNLELAQKWLTLSAKQGTISAQTNLYLLFQDTTFVSDFKISGQARSRIQTLCKNFEEKSPHKIYTVRPNLIAGLDINDQTVFLGHDDTWMKSGKDGFAITDKELACRYLFEDVKKISYETLLKAKTLKSVSDGIFADDIRIAYCCNSAANAELLKLYQDIRRILLRA